MVLLACLLVLMPLAAYGSPEEIMQYFMSQAMAKNGWGKQQMRGDMDDDSGSMDNDMDDYMKGGMRGSMGGGMTRAQFAGNPEDYEAYQKWCDDRKMAMAEQEQQKELLMEFQRAQMEKKREMEKARIHAENKEKKEAMMAHMKMLKQKMSELSEYDSTMSKFMELKHVYMFGLTMEFLKFCKCSDFTDDLERYFIHGGVGYKGGEEFDLDDLEGFDSTNAQDVARAIANKPKVDQVKAFFGGLAYNMCMGARSYVEQVKQWEGQYRFLNRLM